MHISAIEKITDEEWLNLYRASYVDKMGEPKEWIFSSRRDVSTEPDNKADAVIIVPIKQGVQFWDGSCGDTVTLIKEFRIPLRDWEIGFPAGIIEDGETPEQAAARELFEETGLKIAKVLEVSPPLYSSAGMTDESTIFVYALCEGEITNKNTESHEQIHILSCTLDDLSYLLSDDSKKFGAKCWPTIKSMVDNGRIL